MKPRKADCRLCVFFFLLSKLMMVCLGQARQMRTRASCCSVWTWCWASAGSRSACRERWPSSRDSTRSLCMSCPTHAWASWRPTGRSCMWEYVYSAPLSVCVCARIINQVFFVQTFPKCDLMLDNDMQGSGVYLPELDEPEYCNPQNTCLWELHALKVAVQK